MLTVPPIMKQNLSQNVKQSLRSYLTQLNADHIDKVPTEVELAKQLSVSRGTIRQALDDLEKEGLILRIHGRGTFINKAGFQVKVNMARLLEFGTVIQQSGYQASSKLILLEEKAAPENVSKILFFPQNHIMYHIVRVYFADSTPAIYSQAFIPKEMFKEQPDAEVWEKASNFEVLRTFAGRLIMHDQVEVSVADKLSIANELNTTIYNMPPYLLRLDASGFDQDNTPAIYGSAFYNTDLVRFQLFRGQE